MYPRSTFPNSLSVLLNGPLHLFLTSYLLKFSSTSYFIVSAQEKKIVEELQWKSHMLKILNQLNLQNASDDQF